MNHDVCSTCGKLCLVSTMTDLTRVGYDPAMVYECAECTTSERIGA
jgi:hypothetical protein